MIFLPSEPLSWKATLVSEHESEAEAFAALEKLQLSLVHDREGESRTK